METTKQRRYLLSGLVRCALCEGPMRGSTTKSRRKYLERRYACHKASGGCGRVSINEAFLDRLISNAVFDHIGASVRQAGPLETAA